MKERRRTSWPKYTQTQRVARRVLGSVVLLALVGFVVCYWYEMGWNGGSGGFRFLLSNGCVVAGTPDKVYLIKGPSPNWYIYRREWAFEWLPSSPDSVARVPLWTIAVICGLAVAFIRPRARNRTGVQCKSCGHSLAGLPREGRCPECGHGQPAPPTEPRL